MSTSLTSSLDRLAGLTNGVLARIRCATALMLSQSSDEATKKSSDKPSPTPEPDGPRPIPQPTDQTKTKTQLHAFFERTVPELPKYRRCEPALA